MNGPRHILLADRREAGVLLAQALDFLRDEPGLLVLALPRGGVPVGFELACALHATLDVLVVRKIGMPDHPEYAVGAIASGGLQVLDALPQDRYQRARIESVVRQERVELERRESVYRAGRPPPHILGRPVILVDDGLATGATMEAAARAVRQQQPSELVVAAPVASASAARRLAPWVDRMVFLDVPEPFRSVSRWYRDFPQCEDAQVQALLAAIPQPQPQPQTQH